MSDPENEGKGFKVTDRRKFTSEGELREHAEASPEPTARRAPSERHVDARASAPPAGAAASGSAAEASVATFLDLVGMLATNAMLQLGDMPNPASGERVENLQAVQDMIAFLDILQQKTKGNLSQQEGEVLEQVLYDLRMRYMAKAKILNL